MPPRLMPFGKFRDTPIDKLPDGYLAWLLGIDLREPLKSWVDEEAELRWGAGAHSGGDVGETAMRIITAGYRTLALKAHPDQGGSTVEMQELNAAMAVLRRYVKEELL